MSHDDLDDLRATLRGVDRELDHARVARAVDARRRTTRWAPLAAAAAVACVLLASVGTLAWVTARDEPRPAPQVASPLAPLPDAEVLAAQVRRAVAEGGVACSRVTEDGRFLVEQLRANRSGRAVVALLGAGEDATGGAWPGCGPATDPTFAPTTPSGSATPPSTVAVKALLTRDVFAPLDDARYRPTAVAPTTLVVERTTGPELLRLRYEYELDPATLRPVGVRVTGPDGAAAVGTVAWFARGTEQDRYLRANERPARDS